MEPLQISLRQMEYFVAAADGRTMAAAAQRLYVTPSAVSLAISEVERILQVQLFIRHKVRGLTLTSEGSEVLASARSLLAAAEELQRTGRLVGESLSGSLSVGCSVTLMPFLMPGVLAECRSRHPALAVTMLEGELDLQDRLLDGGCEVAIVYDLDLRDGFSREVLRTTRPSVVLPAGHRLARRKAVHLEELMAEPLILFSQPQSTRYFMGLFDSAGLQPDVAHRTTSFETVRALVGRGLGYSVLIQRPAGDLTYEGRSLVFRPIADDVPVLSIVLLHVAGRRSTRRAEAFASICRQLYADRGEAG